MAGVAPRVSIPLGHVRSHACTPARSCPVSHKLASSAHSRAWSGVAVGKRSGGGAIATALWRVGMVRARAIFARLARSSRTGTVTRGNAGVTVAQQTGAWIAIEPTSHT